MFGLRLARGKERTSFICKLVHEFIDDSVLWDVASSQAQAHLCMRV